METYTQFAEVYDRFMDEVPYEDWCARLVQQLRANGIEDGLVLDLGCGTGAMTRRLQAAGYDMIGVDLSVDMLNIARAAKEGTEILYLCQDMRSFELYGTVRAVVSVCDSMNYLLTEEDLLTVFRLVNNYLDPGGIFCFDMNMAEKYLPIAEATLAENRSYGSFIWENDFDSEAGINESVLTFFVEEKDGRFRRFEETHVQRVYPEETIKSLIIKSGLEFLKTEQVEGAERLLFCARECTK